MSVEVVAVRWSCWACEATVITGPDAMPEEWFEWSAPPWRAQHPPRHCCPDHTAEARRISRGQWAGSAGRTHVVSVAEYESVKVRLGQALHDLERLKFSGQRAGDLEV